MSHISEAATNLEDFGRRPPSTTADKMGRREKHEQAARVRRFLSLPPELQEGVLRYGEQIQKAYMSPKY